MTNIIMSVPFSYYNVGFKGVLDNLDGTEWIFKERPLLMLTEMRDNLFVRDIIYSHFLSASI